VGATFLSDIMENTGVVEIWDVNGDYGIYTMPWDSYEKFKDNITYAVLAGSTIPQIEEEMTKIGITFGTAHKGRIDCIDYDAHEGDVKSWVRR
jgi:hypothetical protein